jgi:NAD(P)H-dependent FMN reductase
MPKILLLSGSLRQPSWSRAALEIAAEGLRRSKVEVTVEDLGPLQLPLFVEGAEPVAREVAALKQAARSCDALIVSTPVYHDSFSGVLKNALDHLYLELSDKVVALIAVGGGRTGQGQALEHLRAVFREAGSWVLPRQVAVARASEAFDENGRPTDPDLEARLIRLGQELVLRARQLRPPRPATAGAAKPPQGG